MVTYEEALKIAREFTSEFTQCTEMEDAFIFIIDHLTQYPYEYMFEVQLCAQ